MAVSLVIENLVPLNPPEQWRHPLSLSVREHTFLVIRTLPALSAELFRQILATERPAHGSVTVLGELPPTLSRRAIRQLRSRIGSVLMPDGLVANMTVRKNLALPLIFASGLSEDEVDERVDLALEVFGLKAISTLQPATLPPDARQIAALARAVVGSPKLLLLDDPLASVGTVETERLLAVCRQFASTVVATTHRRNAVLYDRADEIALWDEEGFRPAGQSIEQVAS